MLNIIYFTLYVLALATAFAQGSSTALFSSTTPEVETTTDGGDTGTSTMAATSIVTDVVTTADKIDTTISDTTISTKSEAPTSDFTSTESDTTTGDFTTTSGGDTITSSFTTTNGSDIDFTKSLNVDSTTSDLETSHATDSITTEITTSTRQETELITKDEPVSASTSDGTTTPPTTTSSDVSTNTYSVTTFIDPVTSTASETTTTTQVSSTTPAVPSTTRDLDTTTADTITTTDLPQSSMSDATGTVTPCPTNEVTMTDDARNYIIIALSIVLGIMSIGIIIWCVLSRVQRNKVSYMKNNMVSTGTQTDDYISKELYFRPLPPIDTQMKVVSAKPLFDVHTKFSAPEKHPIDIHVEIVSEDHLDTKIDIFPESKCKTCVELPTAHDSIPQSMNRSSAFETEYTTNNFTTKPIPISSSSESDSDTLSNKCDDFKAKYFKDTDDIFQVESSIAHAGIPSPDDENSDTSPLEAGATPLACETNATSLDSKASEKELLGESEAVKEILFIHTLNVSDLDKANDENTMSKANITNAGMENKRPSFQITHCFNEEVEEIISLDTEDKVPKVRHVTFKEPQRQTTDHKSSSVENGVSDNTLIGPKFRGLLTTNTNTVETSPDKLKMNRKRKRVVRKKSPYTDPIKSSTLKSQAQKRYEATYNIIADAYFKPDFTKEKVWNHLKKFSTRNKLRLKAKTKSKRNISQSEPKFQSEPYGSGSLYSRLSDFES